MLIITAKFPGGEKQNFGRPDDLLRYMRENSYLYANVEASYVFDKVACLKLSVAEVEYWATMGKGRDGE